MEERVRIINCLKCGRKGYLYQDDSYSNITYSVVCENCGNKTQNYPQIEIAIKHWNEENTPKSMKPTYHCGNCGEQIYLGFTECPKCSTMIEW